VGQERLGPSYFFIPLVIGPLNSLVWYVPSLRYTRGLGWRMHFGAKVTESSTNKQHHLSTRKQQSVYCVRRHMRRVGSAGKERCQRKQLAIFKVQDVLDKRK